MYEVWEAPDIVTAFGTLLAGAAACCGAFIAGLGLNTWRRQLNWQVNHDLAKRSLLTLYRFRDSLYSIRHPAMSEAEMKLSDDERREIVAGGERSAGVINAYANRWKRHSEMISALDAIILETDAVWGQDLRILVQPLKELQQELYVYISLHIDGHLRGNTELAKSYREILSKKRDILYDLLNAEKDEFRKDFEARLGEIENYLRSKLSVGN